MNLHRAPQTLIALGTFLAGLWFGQLIADPLLGMVAGGLGVALIAVGGGLQLPAARRRWPRLASKRSRLSRLFSDTTDIRSELKRDDKARIVDRVAWEPRLQAFVADFWERLGAIEPDDVRRLKLKISDFDSVSNTGPRDPLQWAPRMLDLLEKLRTLVEARMQEYPLE